MLDYDIQCSICIFINPWIRYKNLKTKKSGKAQHVSSYYSSKIKGALKKGIKSKSVSNFGYI